MSLSSKQFALTRRAFAFGASAMAGGLVAGFYAVTQGFADATSTTFVAPEITAWITIDADNTTTIRVARSEMGQGSFTALPMLVAEELECDWNSVRAEYAAPNENIARDHAWGDMTTASSISIRASQKYLRKAGAQARCMLIEEAAERWGVPPTDCSARLGIVTHPASGRLISYGELAGAASTRPVPADVPLKRPEDWRLIGTSVHRLDAMDKVIGKPIYAGDVRLPGMLFAAVAACPSFGGRIESFDASRILSMPGVQQVVSVNDTAVAVLADTWWHAKRARDSLDISWDRSAAQGLSTPTMRADFARGLDSDDAPVGHRLGNVNQSLASARTLIQAEYEAPYLAHATMEPQTCVAHVKDGRAEVWAPTQNGEGTLRNVAAALNIDVSKVTVHKCHLGGGFGRRGLAQDWARMAALIAKQIDRPIMMLWSREEDVRHDCYRPMVLARLVAGFDKQGELIGWKTKLCGSSIRASLSPERLKNGMDIEMMSAFLEEDMAYDVPNFEVSFMMRNTPVPVGFWRGVNHSQNGFFRECFVDELAYARGEDPYLYRRRLLVRSPRSLAVLDAVAKHANWGHTPAGVFQGLALVECYNSVAAQVVEISVSRHDGVKVKRVVCAIDAGYVVNPNTVEAQIQGAVVFGLSAALYGQITLKDGEVQQSNFDSYRVLRLAEMPLVETHIVSSGDRYTQEWGGIGEPGLPPVAPALYNAVFAATGKRFRSLPLSEHGNDLGV
jgi:isoquinoline 1-oxidoreductase subunit beta